MRNILELRDKGAFTRVLVLIELLKGKKRLKEISSSLNITPQGTSLYIKNLQKEGLVDKKLDPTTHGVAFIQKFLANLSNFVDEAYGETGIISSCEAIASGKINKKDRVFLRMEDGMLIASKDVKSSSSGISTQDAAKGDPLIVSNLEGIIEVKRGYFYFLHVDISDYHNDEKLRRIKKFVEKNDITVIGSFGITAKTFCDRANLGSNILAPVETCIEGSVKGMNSLLVYSQEMASFFFQKMAANVNKYRINPKSVEI
ncbi:MAG: winged helix-turn-helix transcriptional regulator [Candidatus Thermoplasmatota archaeon]|jgi:putative transcriptional regulator|nr:winged helix-turn-helix transcriptional regulator [Candidatus Thermoplasmatota archaeon]